MSWIPSSATRAVLNAYRITASSNSVNSNSTTRLGSVSTIESPAQQYTPGRTETTVQFDGYCDDADADVVASDWQALTNSGLAVATVGFAGLADGASVIFGEGAPTSVSITAQADETVANSYQVMLSGGGYRGYAGLNPATPFTTTQTSTSVDNGAATTGGFCMAVHVTHATTDGEVTFHAQHSPDDSTWADLDTVVVEETGFGVVKATSGTVDRYTRLQAEVTESGTFQASMALARI